MTASPRPARRPLFSEEETTTIGELREGDFLVSVPAFRGIRGYRINSGVTEITYDDSWVERGYGRAGFPVPGRLFRTLSGGLLSYPDAAPCVVRRRLLSA